MDIDEPYTRGNRFKHQSYNAALKEVHLPSALNKPDIQHDIDDNESQFHHALEHWKQLNLAPSFLRYAQRVGPLSASMPLLLHSWREVVDLWMDALKESDDEGLRALLDLMQHLTNDLRTTLSPIYNDLLSVLLKFLPKTISPASLTALLATFASLFKFLLAPSTELDLLESTWSSVLQTLPKCQPEIQRAMAEVWGSVLRRFKLPVRERAVYLVISSVTEIEDASAWVFVFACKSVSQSLHTATVSLIAPLVEHFLSCDNPGPVYNLLRRVLTAFIHHVKNADQFAPLADIIVKRYGEVVRAGDAENGHERLRRVMELVAIPCAVRQGSRLSEKQLATIATETPNVPLSDITQRTWLRLASALLMAGNMALWIGSGRKILEHSWTDPIVGIRLHGSLADLGWGGWKAIALPDVLRRTPQLLENHSEAVHLLAVLHREKRLGEVDVVWKQRLDTWVTQRLANWTRSDTSAAELEDILVLSKYIPSLTPALVNIVNASLESDAAEVDTVSFATLPWVIGTCFEGLAKREPKEFAKLIDLTEYTEKCVARWPDSEHVVSGLVALWSVSSSNAQLDLESLYANLKPSISSHSHPLRLAVLSLLASSATRSSSNTQDVVKRCLLAEEVPLDVKGARERIVRVGRIAVVVKDEDHLGAEIAIRWLIAQLKVNLRPVWTPANAALASLAQRFGELVWRIVFDDLQSVSKGEMDDTGFASMEGDPTEDHESDDPWEQERSWRDPSAHKLKGIVTSWLDEARRTKSILERIRTSKGRLDRQSYEAQLLACLGECSTLAEKHNRELIPFFLSLVDADDTSRIARTKLTGWLTLLSKFSNPKSLYSTGALQALYTSLLSHPDRALQTLAFSCILTYKPPHLLRHEDRIRSLLDATRWRDELTNLDLTMLEANEREEVVDAITRLLFGIMLERRGRSRGADRRAAVLSTLGGCTDDELRLLVDLMLRPFRVGATSSPGQAPAEVSDGENEAASERQQLGFLMLLSDVLKSLGSRLVPYWPALLHTTIEITSRAHARVQSSMSLANSGNETGETEAAEDEEGDEETDIDVQDGTPSLKSARALRQLGIKRFADFLRQPIIFEFSPYLPSAFDGFIASRLAALDQENTQAPSALLELFYTWTLRPEYALYLTQYDTRILPKVYNCLVAKNVKPAVISRVFDVVDRILALATTDQQISDAIVAPYVSILLENIALLVERSAGNAAVSSTLGQRQISILSQISHHCTDEEQASTLLRLFIPLLRKPAKVVPEKVKVDLLKIFCNLFVLIPEISDSTSDAATKAYELLAQLFQSLRSRAARLTLVSAFEVFASRDSSLKDVAELLSSLNAYSSKRIDEPDFDRRLEAFIHLNESSHKSLTCRQWLPILYNALNFIQDPDELAIRNNSALALRHFVDIVATNPGSEFEALFLRVLYPGLKNGLRSKNELVRSEVLSIIAYAVEKCTHIATLQEMRILLAGGDEEANVFNNIHHVQMHRRSRALRRLAEICDEGSIRSSTLAEIFVPLVGNYIVSVASFDHHVVNDAILATGRIAKHLSWGAYYALVQRYLKLSREKDESERVAVRTLVSVLDHFHFTLEEAVPPVEDGAGEEDVEEGDEAQEEPPKVTPGHQPNVAKISDAVTGRLLPTLLNHLEKRDPTTEDGARIPIAIGIVKVAMHLPKSSGESQITRLVTILSQILKSKSQDTRDLTRETLCKIAVTLGSSYLRLIFRELRGALLRGPQLHVLAYTAHSILVHVTTGDHAATFGVLDDCVADVAHVSAEVIFGESGKDVQAEEFKTKMREVRASSSRGLDSFMITAKHISPPAISGLLAPVRSIMQETTSLKIMNLVEEVLKRVASGLNANKHLIPAELLVLCHTLIKQNSQFLKPVAPKRKKHSKGDAIVQTKRHVAVEMDHLASNSYRFVAFGLDLLNTAMKRGKIDFKDRDVMSRLEAMTVVVGNTLYSTSTPVLLLGLRCVAGLVKCPLKSLDQSLPVFIRQILDVIKQAGNTESEVVQVAFKSLAGILRDGPTVHIQEQDLVYLLELLSPDLEDHERQASVFTMLRAIVSRKFVVPEIYDVMDKVSEVMVTSQSTQVQELCRGVLLQFLLDYPQGKGRLRNQMAFLAKNLSYEHESGRRSVMELLGAIIAKFDEMLVKEYAELLFVALIMVIANDSAAKCREMAAQLIKVLFTRLDDKHRNTIVAHLHSWAAQTSQAPLLRVSLQIYGLVVDVMQLDVAQHLPMIVDDVSAVLIKSAAQLDALEDDSSMEVDLEWQAVYHGLSVMTKLLGISPVLTTEDGKVPWEAVSALLLFPHAWVRTAACRLLGQLFHAVPVAAPSQGTSSSPLLTLDGMRETARRLTTQLKSEHLEEPLSLQIVKNLFYLGKCFDAMPLAPPSDSNESEADEEEEPTGRTDDVNPLPWLFSKLSYQIKSAHIARRNRSRASANWSRQPLSVLRWFAAMTSFMEATRLERFLVHILTPIYRISEDDTIREPQMDELKLLATELQDLVQKKVGVTKFSAVYQQIRQKTLDIRRERKATRVIQVSSMFESCTHSNLLYTDHDESRACCETSSTA
ncbi:hypothetical protein HGRIS_001795 [Hohenbuehelia grisea]|uniref:ARM repeat superfamily protein n=1 Tax=Hohenbuehelia grisea TaxID=104357 RepID=A0ABR3JK88_9AGAR